MLAESIALRVARLNARTRSGFCVAAPSVSAPRDAPPHEAIATDTQAKQLVTAPRSPVTASSQPDESGRFNGVSGRS